MKTSSELVCSLTYATQNEHKQDLAFVMSTLSMRAYPDFALVWDPRVSLQLALLVLFEQKSFPISIRFAHQDALF